MNLSQIHERLRLELLRRIQRGTLSAALLARQTGFGQSHLSNFLLKRRGLSLTAMDRILEAQLMDATDLLHNSQDVSGKDHEQNSVPIVSPSAALYEPNIRPSTVQHMMPVPLGIIESTHPRSSSSRHAWQRFVAIRIGSSEALPMEPIVMPDALVLLDRHYTSLTPYCSNRLNVYAVRHETKLALRYLDFLSNHLVLRPLNIAFPVELIELTPGESPSDLIAGRVVLVSNVL